MQCITLVNYGCYIIAITRMRVEVEMRGERREERGSLEGSSFFFLALEYVEPMISKTD